MSALLALALIAVVWVSGFKVWDKTVESHGYRGVATHRAQAVGMQISGSTCLVLLDLNGDEMPDRSVAVGPASSCDGTPTSVWDAHGDPTR